MAYFHLNREPNEDSPTVLRDHPHALFSYTDSEHLSTLPKLVHFVQIPHWLSISHTTTTATSGST